MSGKRHAARFLSLEFGASLEFGICSLLPELSASQTLRCTKTLRCILALPPTVKRLVERRPPARRPGLGLVQTRRARGRRSATHFSRELQVGRPNNPPGQGAFK